MSRRDLLCGRCGDPAPYGFAVAFDDGRDRRVWACPVHREAALLTSRASWERPLSTTPASPPVTPAPAPAPVPVAGNAEAGP